MKNQTWFIGDWHFGHTNIIGFCDRPFTELNHMNEGLIDLHNAVVKPNDTVYVLGDVAFGRKNLHYVKRMNGNKRLILGNHDVYGMEEYKEVGFNKIYGMKEYTDKETGMCFIMTHAPIHPMQLERRYATNIHGHLHTHDVKDDRYVNVNIDRVGAYVPVNIEEIRRRVKQKIYNVALAE